LNLSATGFHRVLISVSCHSGLRLNVNAGEAKDAIAASQIIFERSFMSLLSFTIR